MKKRIELQITSYIPSCFLSYSNTIVKIDSAVVGINHTWFLPFITGGEKRYYKILPLHNTVATEHTKEIKRIMNKYEVQSS